MSGFRNRFVFPDAVWGEAARKLDGEFVKGRWLANSEIKLLHRGYPITLGVRFGAGKDGIQYTTAILEAPLRPHIRFVLYPKIKGLIAGLTRGLLSRTGKRIDLPSLKGKYSLMGEDPELANRLFGHHDFVAALDAVSQDPTVVVGRTVEIGPTIRPKKTKKISTYRFARCVRTFLN